MVGIVLLVAAARLFRPPSKCAVSPAMKPVPLLPALGTGAGIGMLSGLTGTGGGIFLSPLLLFMVWVEMRESAGVSAAFILLNSLAGLAGQRSSLIAMPNALPYWAIAAVLGSVIGTELGSRRLGSSMLRRLLAVVLLVAGGKLIFSV